RELMASNCRDESCLFSIFEERFGPQVANVLSAGARAAMQAHEPQAAGTCMTLTNTPNGFVGVCEFDPLAAGATDSVMHTDTAPNSLNGNPAQLAIAFALAEGADCRPGTNLGDDAWLLAGCFPIGSLQPAPVLSPLTTAIVALLLLSAGLFGIRYV